MINLNKSFIHFNFSLDPLTSLPAYSPDPLKLRLAHIPAADVFSVWQGKRVKGRLSGCPEPPVSLYKSPATQKKKYVKSGSF